MLVRPAEVCSSISCLEACCAAVLPPSVNADINPLNAELNPICHLLALLGAHHILHVNRIRVKVSSSSGVCASAAVTFEMPSEYRNISVKTSSLNVQTFKETFLDDRSVQHSPAFYFSAQQKMSLTFSAPAKPVQRLTGYVCNVRGPFEPFR